MKGTIIYIEIQANSTDLADSASRIAHPNITENLLGFKLSGTSHRAQLEDLKRTNCGSARERNTDEKTRDEKPIKNRMHERTKGILKSPRQHLRSLAHSLLPSLAPSFLRSPPLAPALARLLHNHGFHPCILIYVVELLSM